MKKILFPEPKIDIEGKNPDASVFFMFSKNWCCQWQQVLSLPFLLFVLLIVNPFQGSAQITIDGNPADWPAAFANPAITVKTRVVDPVNSQLDNIWTQGSSASNEINTWAWTTGGANDKGDIHNAGVALIGTKVYFHLDRHAQNGDEAAGIWFFVNPVSLNMDGTFSGLHTNGDILITTHFINGGNNPERFAYVWTNGVLVERVIADVVLSVRVNLVEVAAPAAWGYQSKFGPPNVYPANAFIEGFIDLGAPEFQDLDICFSTFLIETRNSQSLTASLEDLVVGSFATTPTVMINDVTACAGGSALFTATANGGIPPYEFSFNGGPFSSTNTYSINPVTASAQVTVVARGSQGCLSALKTGTLTLNAIDPGSIEGDQTLCAPFNPVPFTCNTPIGSGTLTFQWQSNTTGCNAAFSNINGATSSVYDPPTVAVTTYYRRVVTSTLNGVACSAISNCLTVKLNPINPGSIAGDQTLCSPFNPAAFTSTEDASGGGVITYQWQISTTSAVAGFSNINGATMATFDMGIIGVKTWFRRVAISTLDNVPCSANSNVVVVTPNDITPGAIAGNQTGCAPFDPAAFTSTAPGSTANGGVISYQWQSNTTGCNNENDFSNINGATAATYNAPVVTQTTYFRRVATSTLNGVACSANSNCLTVTPSGINPGSIAGNQTLCAPFDPAAFTSVAATGDGTITYQWQSNTTGCNNVNDFSNINGATAATYNAPVISQTTYYRRIATSTLNGVQCVASSNCLTVTPNAINPGSIAGNQTLCAPFDPVAFTSVAATGGGTITYQWQSNTTGCNNVNDFSNINGATAATYNAPVITQTTYYRRVATSTLNGVSCVDYSNCLTVTPNAINPGSIAGNQTLCAPFDPVAFTSVAATGGGTITYQWQSNTTGCNNVNDFSNINGATAATYNAPVITQTTYYRRVATSTLNGVPCVAYSNCLTATPNAINPGSISGNQTVCIGDDPAAFTSVPAAGDGTVTYQWYSNTTGCGTAFTIINGATSATYDPGIANVTTYYQRMATSTLNGVVCSATSNCLTVTAETCGGPLCTYTQGYYGNSGGRACSPDGQFSTIQLIQNSIGHMPGQTLYLGIGANSGAAGGSFTAVAADASALISLLPGGGASAALGGDYTPLSVQPLKNGRIFNNLLSQTITMALNLYMPNDSSQSVGTFSLAGSGGMYIVTAAKSSGSSCIAPEQADCAIQPNAIKSYYMPANVIAALPVNATVWDLFQMAKNALGGQLPAGVSYTNVQSAVDAINNAFDGCRYFIEFSSTPQYCPVPVTAKQVAVEGISFDVYPVPFKDNLTMVYNFETKSEVTIEIFDIRGVLLSSQTDTDVQMNKEVQLDMNFRVGQSQVYFVRITADGRSIVKKVISRP